MKCEKCGAENPEQSSFCQACGERFQSSTHTVMSEKKLVRPRHDTKIAGVCGGVAQYLNMDSTLVRIIFLILLLTGTIGLWIYLVIWAVAPWDCGA